MFSRADLKEKGMFAFKRNYWTCVLVALILSFAVANRGGGGSYGRGYSSRYRGSSSTSTGNNYNFNSDNFNFDQLKPGSGHGDTGSPDWNTILPIIGAMSILFLVVFLVILAISLTLKILLLNPLLVGCRRFFTVNSFDKANISEVGFGFKKERYWNIVKVMFMKNLFIGLWTLLFIIPGIIKSYEYMMVEYILTEDPTLDYKDALEQSKQMMYGYKWETFVLQLSFIGWSILGLLTCGILLLFYVNPYVCATMSELFLFLRSKKYPSAAPYYTPVFAGGFGQQPGQGFNPQMPNQGYNNMQPGQNYGYQDPNQNYGYQQPGQGFNPDDNYNNNNNPY